MSSGAVQCSRQTFARVLYASTKQYVVYCHNVRHLVCISCSMATTVTSHSGQIPQQICPSQAPSERAVRESWRSGEYKGGTGFKLLSSPLSGNTRVCKALVRERARSQRTKRLVADRSRRRHARRKCLFAPLLNVASRSGNEHAGRREPGQAGAARRYAVRGWCARVGGTTRLPFASIYQTGSQCDRPTGFFISFFLLTPSSNRCRRTCR